MDFVENKQKIIKNTVKYNRQQRNSRLEYSHIKNYDRYTDYKNFKIGMLNNKQEHSAKR